MQKTLMPPFMPKEKKPVQKHIAVLIVISFVCLAAFFVAVFIPEGKNEEEYLQELIEKKEAGVFLASGEEKDYCLLMATLRDSIVLSCLPVLEGVNWERPPKSPEDLGPMWVDITSDKQDEEANSRTFQHVTYKKIIIYFDKGNPDDNGFAAVDHWHRQNPNATHKIKHARLDERGKPVHRKSGPSHLPARK